jgi:hypothetical protein
LEKKAKFKLIKLLITLKTLSMSNKTKVYGLFIGINIYPVSPLYACVNDATKMHDYVKARKDIDGSDLKLLTNKAATKDNIIKHIRSHLGQAQGDDVALLYFSGHGAQEQADEKIWLNELDGKLETIACFPEGKDKTSLLADKELRYLIHELAFGTEEEPKAAPPHILTIFDCCHSGDNTRSAAAQELEGEEVVHEKRYKNVFPQREWKDFIFAGEISPSQLALSTFKEIFPQGPHVSIAASLDKQPALEVGGTGLFTRYLLQVLKYSGGLIDYVTLHSLISNFIRFRYKQIPQLAAQGAPVDLLRAGFLNQAVEYQGDLYGESTYNKVKGWLLNMGQMHGIVAGDKVFLEVDKDKTIEAVVDKTYTSTAEIAIDFETRRTLDKEGFYKTKVAAYNTYPVNFYINNADGLESEQKSLEKAIEDSNTPIRLVSNEGAADYTLHFNYGMVFLTEAFEALQPVMGPIFMEKERWESSVMAMLRQLAKWEFAKQLHNSKVKLLKKAPLAVEILQKKEGEMVQVPTDNNEYIIDQIHWEEESERYRAYITIKLTNNFKRPLYFCLLTLSESRTCELQVDTEEAYGLVEKAVMELDKGQTYRVFQHYDAEIPFKVEEEAIRYNKAYSTTWFKLLISTKDDISYQHLLTATTRSGADLPPKNVHDWTTQTFAIKLANPRYNKITERDKHEYLSDSEMAPFAKSLYTLADADKQGTLKPEIQLIQHDGDV